MNFMKKRRKGSCPGSFPGIPVHEVNAVLTFESEPRGHRAASTEKVPMMPLSSSPLSSSPTSGGKIVTSPRDYSKRSKSSSASGFEVPRLELSPTSPVESGSSSARTTPRSVRRRFTSIMNAFGQAPTSSPRVNPELDEFEREKRKLLEELDSTRATLEKEKKKLSKLLTAELEMNRAIAKRNDKAQRMDEIKEMSSSVKDLTSMVTSSSKKKGKRMKFRLKFVPDESIELCEKLSSGSNLSCNEVYVASVLGLRVAMKRVKLNFSNLKDLQAFYNEISIMQGLSHTRILKYCFHAEYMGQVCLFYQLANTTLRKYIDSASSPAPKGITRQTSFLHDSILDEAAESSESMFTYNELLNVLVQVAEGLDYLHGKNIIHRDLKADNIFIELDEFEKVSNCMIGDFDVSTAIHGHQYPLETIGTIGYMAPEVYSGHTPYTYKADIYSFGMLVYELITGETPWLQADPFDIPNLVMEGRSPAIPVPLQQQYEPLMGVYHACTHLLPDQRPSSSHLLKVLQDLPRH